MKAAQRKPARRLAITPALTLVALAAIRFYRAALRPSMPWGCKFYPSCSAYALEVIAKHGLGRGLRLALRRLVRCRPGVFGGYDPVPDRAETQSRVLGADQPGLLGASPSTLHEP